MTAIDYVTVDVFTGTRFGGNPLAVVPDARGLSKDQMQRIAAEFNYSESTFVLPPETPDHTARVRIFTRVDEIPFAGHPNVGTGYVLGQQKEVFGTVPGASMRFEETAGSVDIALVRDNGAVVGARIDAPRPLEVGASMDPAALARCVSLPTDAIATDRHPPTLASVGLPFFMAETDSDSLERAGPDLGAFRSAAERFGLAQLDGRFSVFLYARTGTGIERVRARMFAPMSGTWEDPATGSASAALGAYLAQLEPEADLEAEIDIAQGVEMGRPSAISVTARKEGGRVARVTIEGRCVTVMRGTIEVR